MSSEEDEDLVLDIGEEEAECMFCSGFFSDDHAGEQWIQCSKCFKWAHCDCANGAKISVFQKVSDIRVLYCIETKGINQHDKWSLRYCNRVVNFHRKSFKSSSFVDQPS